MLKVVATSDLHGQLGFTIPECDLFILAGDLCPDNPWTQTWLRERQETAKNSCAYMQAAWLITDFLPWLKKQPAKKIVYIWGNHDFVGEIAYGDQLMLPVAQNIAHEYCQIAGKWIFGDPYIQMSAKWAFSTSEGKRKEMVKEKYPADCDQLDILVTHPPPYGTGDFTVPKYGSEHAGDKAIAKYLASRPELPKLHVYGHIHEGYGQERISARHLTANVASVDEFYKPRDLRYTEFEL